MKIIMERVLYIRFSYRFVSHDLAVSPPTQVDEGGEGEKERSDGVVDIAAVAACGGEGYAGVVPNTNLPGVFILSGDPILTISVSFNISGNFRKH